MSAKTERRKLKIISCAQKESTVVEQTISGDVVLIKCSGRSTIRCPRHLMDEMLRDGSLIQTEHAGKVFLQTTEEGRLWHRRIAAKHLQDKQEAEPQLSGKQPAINTDESPLGRLYSRSKSSGANWIEKAHWLAGERLRQDFEFAGLSPRLGVDWSMAHVSSSGGARPGSHDAPHQTGLDAKRRFDSAIDAVGPELSGLLLDVCCFLKGIEQVESERRWPRRSAKLLLSVGLSILDRHYNPPPKTKSGKVRHWGGQGYRPSL